MSIIFLLSGFQKLGGFNGTAAYMASLNLPLPELAAIVAIFVECVGGVLVLVGYHTRAVALALAVWCVATALVAHSHVGEPEQAIHSSRILRCAAGFFSSSHSAAETGASTRGKVSTCPVERVEACGAV